MSLQRLHIHLKNLTQDCSIAFITKVSPPLPAKTFNFKFLHGKAFTERVGRLLMPRSRLCASIAAELCEDFNTRALLYNYFRIPSPFLLGRQPIIWHTAILFLHGKVFTWSTLDGAIKIVSWLLQNYLRNLTLKHLFQNSPPLPVIYTYFTTHDHFVSWF